MDREARIARCCQQLGRVYAPRTSPSEDVLLGALRYAIAEGDPTLVRYPADPQIVQAIRRAWWLRGWAASWEGSRITGHGRAAAAGEGARHG